MNRLAVVLVLVLTFPLVAHADEASQRAKAQKIVLMLHTDQQVQQISATFMKQLSDAADKVTGPNPLPPVKAKLDELKKNAADTLESKLSWKIIEPKFVDIYAKTFTEPELDGIIAFYETAPGKALIEKTPAINQQSTALMNGEISIVQGDLRKQYDDYRRNLGTPPAVPPASSTPSAPSATPAPVTPAPTPRTPK